MASGRARGGGEGSASRRGSDRSRGRAAGNGLSFTDRHPEVVLVVFAAWCAFFAYAYAAGLVSARNVVDESWRAAGVGAVAGLALMTVIVIRYRQQKAGWLLVSPLAVLFFGFLATGRQLFSFLSGAGKITTEFEAGAFGLCALLWCALMIVCLMRVPKARRERVVLKEPKDRLHITRTPNWREAPDDPILLDEWERFAESRSDLAVYDPLDARAREEYIASSRRPGEADLSKAAERLAARDREIRQLDELLASRPDLVAEDRDVVQAVRPTQRKKNFAYERGDGTRMKFHWNGSQIDVSGVGPDRESDAVRMLPIARALGAQLVDDDGTVYR
jgi:hypothetical protein